MLSTQARSFQSPALRQITIEVAKVGGINLGQGVCQLPVPQHVLDEAKRAAQEGINRYTNPRGLLSLREAIAKKLAHFNRIEGLDPETQVLVTCGATGAFESVCATLLDPGDEVVVLEPSYPYHVQALRRYNAKIKFVSLREPDWSLDWDEVKSAVSERTKFVLLNTPGNPTGKVFTREELQQLASILAPFPAMLVTDEIYEYMAFDRPHLSPASLPELSRRTITMGGYSKTFSITGWRIGYCIAPVSISDALATVMDAIYVCAPAPLQEAVARGIEHFDDEFYTSLCDKYKNKRDLFVSGLREIGMDPFVPAGAYYLLSKYEGIAPNMDSTTFARTMIAETGVGAVPSTDFVRDSEDAKWVRFCLAVEDDVLHEALARMSALGRSG